MKNKIKSILLWGTSFIFLNIILYLLCILVIAPYFKVGNGLKSMEEKNNEIIFNDYKLNVKKLITKEDIVININTGKEIKNI